MAFFACGGCVKDLFVTEEEIIDRFTGQELWLWGAGSSGQLGDETNIGKSSPVQTVTGGTNWRSVSIGSGHSAAIKTDGSLWLWGFSNAGVLGNNTLGSPNRFSRAVQTSSGGTNWRSISACSLTNSAIKTDGSLWLWGSGANGALGNNAGTNACSPVQTISGGCNWYNTSTGPAGTSAATKIDGTLWIWGRNLGGGLGDNSIIQKSSPVQTVSGGTDWRSVSLGSHGAAIKTDGSLWLWGYGCKGELGDNSIINKSSPVQTVTGGTNWRSISLGDDHSAAIKTDGSLWLWGYNTRGILGDNCLVRKSSPVQTISGGTNWRLVCISSLTSAAIKTDGSLWLWGCRGNLGNNCILNVSSPVQTISSGTSWRSVSSETSNSAATRLTEY